MPNFHGRFVWYELRVLDAALTRRFYADVVGWGLGDAGPAEPDYTIFSAGSTMIAGMMVLPEAAITAGASPGWIGYIAVDDVTVYAERVQAAGGKILRQPDDIPDVGRFAVVADPQGAPFVLFRGKDGQSPPPFVPEPGYIGWRELMAADHEAAFEFYAGLFGWTKTDAIDMGPMGIYQIFAAGDETIGGMMTKPPAEPKPTWRYYIQVDAIGAAMARVQAGGGSVINGPHQVPGGSWIVHALDPKGVFFALVSNNA
jgi:predicted enzyme related to lactoylglutathione lyase